MVPGQGRTQLGVKGVGGDAAIGVGAGVLRLGERGAHVGEQRALLEDPVARQAAIAVVEHARAAGVRASK